MLTRPFASVRGENIDDFIVFRRFRDCIALDKDRAA